MPIGERSARFLLAAAGFAIFIFLAVLVANSDLSLQVFDRISSGQPGDTRIITRFNPLALIGWGIVSAAALAATMLVANRVAGIVRRISVMHASRRADSLAKRVLDAIGALIAAFDRHDQETARMLQAIGSLKNADEIKKVVADLIAEHGRLDAEMRGLAAELGGKEIEKRQVEEQLDQVKADGLLDALSGLANRRAFDQTLEAAVGGARTDKRPLSLIMVDLDHFKRINDGHGHQVGDEVIRMVGRVLAAGIRDHDLAARFGGEEFALLLPRTTVETAMKVAERIRKKLDGRHIVLKSDNRKIGAVTASFGVAELRFAEDGRELVARADRKLYAAKMAGRNRVVG